MNSLQVFKKGIKRNEIIVYAIALMLVTAGYFNYSANFEHSTMETSATESSATENNTNEGLVENEEKNMAKADTALVENEETEDANSEQANTEEVSTDSSKNENIGDARLVSSEAIENIDTSDYFASSKLERDRNYADMLSTYTKIIEDGAVSETQKAIAMKEITKINNDKSAISVSENLLSTKELENYVVLVNDDSINIVVQVKGDLTKEKVAQIQNIISREFDTEISKIHITEYKK